VLRVPVAAVFGLVGYALVRGPEAASANVGSALMWLLWWPALPVAFLLAGRLWCAVCPFGTISDLVHRVVGVEGTVPRVLHRYGIWIIAAEFLVITWADHVWGIVDSPWGSGVLLLILTSAVIASAAFLPRRSFCRYLCFLGGLSGNYSRAGMVSLQADATVCGTCTSRAACYHGTDTVEACPLFSFPRTLDTAAGCNLCARCVRSCPHDAIRVRPRAPFSELWSIRRPQLEESVLAMAIMGVVLVQNVSEVPGWRSWLSRTGTATGLPVVVVFTLVFLGIVCAPVGLLAAASALASRSTGEGVLADLTRFGYALIPLDIAAFVAHTQADALGHGHRLVVTVARLVGAHPSAGGAALAGPGTIRTVQWCLIAAGTVAALYTTRRIVAGHYRARGPRRAALLSYASLVVLLGAVNVLLFAVPAGS
jgi:ferredoxin